jgi:chromosome segregation ATPase
MAEPTLRDLLDAISSMRAELARVDAKADAIRGDMATRNDLTRMEGKADGLRAEVAAHRAETAKGFAEVGTALAELDRELSKHADVHRELEKDVEAIKRRPARTAARPVRRR